MQTVSWLSNLLRFTEGLPDIAVLRSPALAVCGGAGSIKTQLLLWCPLPIMSAKAHVPICSLCAIKPRSLAPVLRYPRARRIILLNCSDPRPNRTFVLVESMLPCFTVLELSHACQDFARRLPQVLQSKEVQDDMCEGRPRSSTVT